MAVKQNPLLIVFLVLSSSLTISLSRELPNTPVNGDPHTQTLDVSASLNLAHSVLSFNPQTLEPLHQTLDQTSPITNRTTTTTSFSLPLHARDSLIASDHQDYQALTLSRLARDSSRVDSLNTKLQLALDNIKKSDLKPSETSDQFSDQFLPNALSTPVVSGTSEGSGEYFTKLGVGRPSKQFSMVIDTGSDVNWLQCKPCSDCYHQSDPIFDPTASSTCSALTCDSALCGALDTSGCRAGKCLYQVAYGDGSYTIGDFVSETVSFGSSAVNGVALGCGHDNEGLFIGSAGLIGLGGGELSLTSQIKATSFSYCLVNRDSPESSTLEFNSASPADSVFAPILRNRKTSTFYYVNIAGISVGGNPIPISGSSLFGIDGSGNGGIIVDSGTAITRLRAPVYESLRDSFKGMTRELPSANGVALFDTCYDLAGRTSVRVPTVSFQLSGGKTWQLPAKNYLIPVDSSGTFCFAFAPTSSSLSIIGNVQQQGTRVSYDLANNRVGFSPNKC